MQSSAEPVKAVLLDLGATTDLDVPSADMLAELGEELHSRNVRFMLTRMIMPVRQMLELAGVNDQPEDIFIGPTEAVLDYLSSQYDDAGIHELLRSSAVSVRQLVQAHLPAVRSNARLRSPRSWMTSTRRSSGTRCRDRRSGTSSPVGRDDQRPALTWELPLSELRNRSHFAIMSSWPDSAYLERSVPMTYGPIDLTALEFPAIGNRFKGEILPRDVRPGREGDHPYHRPGRHHEGSGRGHRAGAARARPSHIAMFDPLQAQVSQMITQADIDMIAGQLAENSTAGILLIENLWAKKTQQAMLDANGRLVMFERIPHDVVEEALADIAALAVA